MKKITMLIAAQLLLYISLSLANERIEDKPLTIRGRIITELNTASFSLECSINPVSGASDSQFKRITIQVDPKGYFTQKIDVSKTTYLTLIENTSKKRCFVGILGKAGDEVFLDVKINNSDYKIPAEVIFSGKSSKKFECIYRLNKLDYQQLSSYKNFNKRELLIDSLISCQKRILLEYEKVLDKASLDQIKIDETAKLKSEAWFVFKWGNPKRPDFLEDFAPYSFFLNKKWDYEDVQLASSFFFNKYLYEKAKEDYQSKLRKRQFYFEDFYYFVKKNYSGLIREKIILLTMLSEVDMSFSLWRNHRDYSYLVKDAFEIIKTPEYKVLLQIQIEHRINGAKPYNFEFPDDKGNLTMLSDFKGKVVLIDMWSWRCTGCLMFANTFHQKIYPLFKDNPNFKVVSIFKQHGDSTFNFKWWKDKMVIENPTPQYTYLSNINLFASINSIHRKGILKYFDISSMPFLILIGKDGKVFECNVPFANTADSPNVKALIDIITKALAEKE